MADDVGPANGAAWPQTASLLLLRRVMGLGAEVRSVVAARSELSSTELHALEHLAAETMGPAELARRLEVSTAASTGIVDRLETKGHVIRRPYPGDRRRTQVVLTESARAEVSSHLAPMFRAVAEADRELTAEERAVVVRYLSAAVRGAEAVLRAEGPERPGQGGSAAEARGS